MPPALYLFAFNNYEAETCAKKENIQKDERCGLKSGPGILNQELTLQVVFGFLGVFLVVVVFSFLALS